MRFKLISSILCLLAQFIAATLILVSGIGAVEIDSDQVDYSGNSISGLEILSATAVSASTCSAEIISATLIENGNFKVYLAQFPPSVGNDVTDMTPQVCIELPAGYYPGKPNILVRQPGGTFPNKWINGGFAIEPYWDQENNKVCAVNLSQQTWEILLEVPRLVNSTVTVLPTLTPTP